MPNSTTVPHGIRGCASFQVMMPMPGRNISATAVIVVVLVSKLCRTPSVAQKAIKVSEIASSFILGRLHRPELGERLADRLRGRRELPPLPAASCAS